MDGDWDRDPHWNTGLNSLGPNEKQKEREREQRRQDQREPSSDDGWRYRRRPTLEHRTEPPKVQMRSRRRKNMKKEIRTARGVITHWYKGRDLMRVYQGQLDWDWMSTWSNQILWMRPDSRNVAGLESFWKAIDNDTGTCFLCIYWIFGIQSVWILTFLDLEGGGGTWTSHRAGNPDCS